jgi:flagellar basal body-associated protein FliL
MLSTIGVVILSVIVILIICFVIFIVVQINKKTAEQKSEEVEEKKPSEFFKSIRKFWYKYDGLIPMAVLMVACTAIIWVSTH